MLPSPWVTEGWQGWHRPIPGPSVMPAPASLAAGGERGGSAGKGTGGPFCQPLSPANPAGAMCRLDPEKFPPFTRPPPSGHGFDRDRSDAATHRWQRCQRRQLAEGAAGPLPSTGNGSCQSPACTQGPSSLLGLAGSGQGRDARPSLLIWRLSGTIPGVFGLPRAWRSPHQPGRGRGARCATEKVLLN